MGRPWNCLYTQGYGLRAANVRSVAHEAGSVTDFALCFVQGHATIRRRDAFRALLSVTPSHTQERRRPVSRVPRLHTARTDTRLIMHRSPAVLTSRHACGDGLAEGIDVLPRLKSGDSSESVSSRLRAVRHAVLAVMIPPDACQSWALSSGVKQPWRVPRRAADRTSRENIVEANFTAARRVLR